jgi:hypothetical protein
VDNIYLSHLAYPPTTTYWNEGWKNSNLLGFVGPQANSLANYIDAIERRHIRLTNREDELIWKKYPTSPYTPKVGYIALNFPLHQLPKWRWKILWNQKCPQKKKSSCRQL